MVGSLVNFIGLNVQLVIPSQLLCRCAQLEILKNYAIIPLNIGKLDPI